MQHLRLLFHGQKVDLAPDVYKIYRIETDDSQNLKKAAGAEESPRTYLVFHSKSGRNGQTIDIGESCDTQILRRINSVNHLILHYKNKQWAVLTGRTAGGPFVSAQGSNWVQLCEKDFVLEEGDRISLLEPDVGLMLGIGDEKRLSLFKRIKNKLIGNEHRIISVLKDLEKIRLQIEKEKWQSLWWWDKKEEKEIHKLNDLIYKIQKEGTKSRKLQLLSIAVKKIIYAHTRQDMRLMPDLAPKNLEDAIRDLEAFLDKKVEISPERRLHQHAYIDPKNLRDEMAKALRSVLEKKKAEEKGFGFGETDIYTQYYAYYEKGKIPDEVGVEYKKRNILPKLNQLKQEYSKRIGVKKTSDWFFFFVADSEKTIIHRYYFTPRMDRFTEFFEILLQATDKMKTVDETIKFKIHSALSEQRKDRLVLFSSTRLDHLFYEVFHDKGYLFNDEKLPFQTSICKGVSYAPEPQRKERLVSNRFVAITMRDGRLSINTEQDVRINGIRCPPSSKKKPQIDDQDIVLLCEQKEMFKIQLKPSGFRFSFDGVSFDDVWHDNFAVREDTHDPNSHFKMMGSYGTELSSILYRIWKENPSRTPEQIAEIAIERIKGYYSNVIVH